MGLVAADPAPLGKTLPGGAGASGVLVTKLNVLVHKIVDRLDPGPTRWTGAKQLPGGL